MRERDQQVKLQSSSSDCTQAMMGELETQVKQLRKRLAELSGQQDRLSASGMDSQNSVVMIKKNKCANWETVLSQ